ncbi:response regulator [Eubacterium oxidoreducens]|uniref:Stage 0 sporulation protein A homolog n=1 Tax=Eubacterium oxidoreducens TaxID=1732 RepID=A0A1G6AET0_EUBOX|nr:response regulator [Eubacterium oxidoreducens]SDB06927.1 Response regulator receiver domain-containing protein [Eubacterium oxidoreducens]
MEQNEIQVLFVIHHNISFVNGALKVFLEEYNIKTDVLEISKCISNHPKVMPPLVIAEAEMLLEFVQERGFLYDYCIEQGSHIILVDEAENIESLMEVTSPALVAEKFQRPVNAKDVAEKVEELLERIKNHGLRRQVLVVDDSPAFLRTITEWLEDDYNVSVCPSAFAAIKLISIKRPDLILLDYEMPVCSGAQFLEMLNSEEQKERPPVIFLTSKNDQQTVQELLQLKPQGYILKTQPRDSILVSIRNFFEKES